VALTKPVTYAPEAYADLIAAFKTYEDSGFTDYSSELITDSMLVWPQIELGMTPQNWDSSYGGTNFDINNGYIVYSLYDISSDGIPELFIGWTSTPSYGTYTEIFGIYTVVNGEMQSAFQRWVIGYSREEVTLYDDNTFGTEWMHMGYGDLARYSLDSGGNLIEEYWYSYGTDDFEAFEVEYNNILTKIQQDGYSQTVVTLDWHRLSEYSATPLFTTEAAAALIEKIEEISKVAYNDYCDYILSVSGATNASSGKDFLVNFIFRDDFGTAAPEIIFTIDDETGMPSDVGLVYQDDEAVEYEVGNPYGGGLNEYYRDKDNNLWFEYGGGQANFESYLVQLDTDAQGFPVIWPIYENLSYDSEEAYLFQFLGYGWLDDWANEYYIYKHLGKDITVNEYNRLRDELQLNGGKVYAKKLTYDEAIAYIYEHSELQYT